MSTSNNGKHIVLVIFVVILLLFAFRSIFFVLPFGMFPGVSHSFRDAAESVWSITNFSLLRLPMLLLPLAFLALWVYVIVWVYRDAERRGMSGILWALLVLVGNIVGLIIYLIVRSETMGRPREASTEKCPGCGTGIARGFTYCPHCGASLKPVCPGCQKPVDRAWKVCPNCGTSLDPGKSEQG
jgi:hypothetical protein